jgi:ABC-type enterochelin transport system ATPase subunit
MLRIDAALQLDEVVINDMPVIRLNDRPQDEGSVARPIDELSPGQRCSAILPILLLTGSNPLIIDQPEDNLDNRLVRQVIVNILGSIKLKRQVIVATHNPNLPVLGDAEQIVALRAVGDRSCNIDAKGDLHEGEVIKYIADIMEGGREAFQYRESIYAPYWRGDVEGCDAEL